MNNDTVNLLGVYIGAAIIAVNQLLTAWSRCLALLKTKNYVNS